MDTWFEVKKKDVIDLLEKRKDCFPWGDHPDEKYRCLIFWEDGAIRMTVDEFYETDTETYECLRFYTTFIGNSIEDYKNLSEEELASRAYSAWCSGAR
ncbi:MAG: hypothetical protein MJ092_06675 [Lachnospiraceae bacterium]|nr:hypothetical protein [Lachnospiraceae bacterium]